MKTTRLLGVSLLATASFLGACDDDDEDNGTGPTNTATVRFVNTTGQNIDVGMNGTFGAGNGNVAFGNGTSCITVDTAFMPFATGSNQVWLTTGTGSTQTEAFSSSSFAVAANGYTTYVVGPAATGSTTLRGVKSRPATEAVRAPGGDPRRQRVASEVPSTEVPSRRGRHG